MLCLVLIIAKKVINNLVCYVWFAIPVLVKPYILLIKLYPVNRYGRFKMPQYALYSMHGYAPNPEEPKYMIDPESVKIIAHLLEPLLPPGKSAFTHCSPVIGWETPVLPCYSKIIWRGTGLHIHVVQLGVLPGISAIAVNSNGYITFYNHAVIMRILCGLF